VLDGFEAVHVNPGRDNGSRIGLACSGVLPATPFVELSGVKPENPSYPKGRELTPPGQLVNRSRRETQVGPRPGWC
jgi:hypothetical protein